jgi:murein L,D-transpeptidase YcbB/YkuD
VHLSAEHGLNPADYRAAETASGQQPLLSADGQTASRQAALDVTRTDGLVRLLYHLCYGKLDPKTRAVTRDYARPLGGRDASAVVADIIDADHLVDAVTSTVPHDPGYDRLKAGLQRHRRIAEAGGWPTVPDGPTIEPGANDPRLEILARRLTVSGDVVDAAGAVPTSLYSGVLVEAVKRFQVRHGLDADGLVGKATLRALNVSIDQRIEQIRVNLERARWRLDSPPDDFIRINVASFRMSVIRDRKIAATRKVIVGDADNQTPMFEAVLGRIVFNPTWTVPYSIASKELLPAIRRDPDYLRRGRYRLYDRAGNVVAPSTVDWSAIQTHNFPFTIVQQPGPANQLGQVKFLFPNDYSVCMHDTPAKTLFSKARRDFSHGCIRVDEPIELAEVLLEREGWTRGQVMAEVESGKTKAVNLNAPLPVIMVYQTAEVDEQGEMHFYDDLYGRDAALLQALDEML